MNKPRRRPDLVAENRNPLARAGGQRPADDTRAPIAEEAPGANSEAPTRAMRRPRLSMSRRLLGWVLALLGAVGLLTLLLVLFVNGDLSPAPQQRVAEPMVEPILGSAPTAEPLQAVLGSAAPEAAPADASGAAISPLGAAPAAPASGTVSPGFQDFYDAHGGLRILGRPISQAMTVNGREIQWFERARVERWPEFAGTPYEIQLGRLGAEYTSGRQFAPQQFFASRPDLRYVAETEHSLGGAFLAFWEQNGGMRVFGLPISEEFDEVLPDGRTYRVQYFERARLELHPEAAGTPYEVQVGLLGTALYQNESRPDTIQPAPTSVPLP